MPTLSDEGDGETRHTVSAETNPAQLCAEAGPGAARTVAGRPIANAGVRGSFGFMMERYRGLRESGNAWPGGGGEAGPALRRNPSPSPYPKG